MANVAYNRFKLALLGAEIDMSNGGDDIRVALCTNVYVPNIDTHLDFADITNEVVGAGYVADGALLANQAVSQDNVDDEGVFDADNVTWAASTITARYAIIYWDTGVAGTSLLIACIDFGEDKTSTGGDFTITWDAEGIINLG